MNVPNNHCLGSCIDECSCSACVHVRLLVADVAERVGEIAAFDPEEIQSRLEPTIRVAANDGAAVVQILRQDGRAALRAPLDNEANIKGIIRMRVNDLRLSIAARKENRMRECYYEESLAERATDEGDHDDGEAMRLAIHEYLERYVGPLCEAILMLRYEDGCSRREVEELLGLSTKKVRDYEQDSLELLFSRWLNRFTADRKLEEIAAYLR